jgi:hypothetical protein
MKKNIVLSSMSALAILSLVAFMYQFSLPALRFSTPESPDLFSEQPAAGTQISKTPAVGHLCLDVPMVIEKKASIVGNKINEISQVNLRLTTLPKHLNKPQVNSSQPDLADDDLYLFLEKHQVLNSPDTQGQYIYKYEAVMARLKASGIIDSQLGHDKDVASCASKSKTRQPAQKVQEKDPGV